VPLLQDAARAEDAGAAGLALVSGMLLELPDARDDLSPEGFGRLESRRH
jgi:hypothetical protein